MLAAGMKARVETRSRQVFAALASAAVIACLLAPGAKADATWTVTGHGFGHGIGMSQYGAYGYALHAFTYKPILAHYYQGTTVGQAPKSRVRVLLTIASGDVTFKKAISACGRKLNPAKPYRARLSAGAVKLLSQRGRTVASCGAKLKAKGKGRIRIKGNGAYRGALSVIPTSSGAALAVINALDIDKYVQGVIAGEMPSSWPIEALKVQAVAARSYALASSVTGRSFDVYDDTRSQVYDGIAGETDATNRAAGDTKHEVVLYNGAVATTYYSASSGGQTESVEFAFGSDPVPYLKGTDDPYDTTSPLHNWKKTYTQGQLESALGNLLKGSLQDIQITKTGASPRIVTANVVGSNGTTKVTGSQLQSALGTYSTWMSFTKSG
jgi:stage II sporulation protein D